MPYGVWARRKKQKIFAWPWTWSTARTEFLRGPWSKVTARQIGALKSMSVTITDCLRCGTISSNKHRLPAMTCLWIHWQMILQRRRNAVFRLQEQGKWEFMKNGKASPKAFGVYLGINCYPFLIRSLTRAAFGDAGQKAPPSRNGWTFAAVNFGMVKATSHRGLTMFNRYSGKIFRSKSRVGADSRLIFRIFRSYVPGFRYRLYSKYRGPDIYIPAPITLYRGYPEYRYSIISVSSIPIFRVVSRNIICNYINILCNFDELCSGYVPEYSGI